MRVRPLDMHGQSRGGSTEPLRADSRPIDLSQQLALKLRYIGIRVPRTDRPERACLLSKLHRDIRSAAQANAHDHRRARPRARFEDALQHKLDDAFTAL